MQADDLSSSPHNPREPEKIIQTTLEFYLQDIFDDDIHLILYEM